jgi:hypothetical protein
MKPVSTYAVSSWKNRNSENGVNVKMISSVSKTRDSTYSSLLSLSVRRKLRRNTPRELKRSVSERLKTKSVLSPKFSARESRS